MQPQHKISRLDTRPVPDDPAEIYCVMCIRDELLRLPWVLEYHRNLGVNRFFIVDNASADGSTDYLLSQPDVHLFFTSNSYGESSFGITWTNLLLDRFCNGHWCVVIDADELLVYPYCEQTGIRVLCDYLDRAGAGVVYTRMFDMYSDKPVAETRYKSGAPFQDTCPYFDGNGYYTVQTPRFFPGYQIYGGVRKRIFFEDRNKDSLPPVLTKLALVKWEQGRKYLLSTHIMTPAPLADLTGGLLHFKFIGDFHGKAVLAAADETRFDRSREYGVYARLLEKNPAVCFMYEGSIRYRDSMQMTSLGFMSCPKYFSTFLDNRSI